MTKPEYIPQNVWNEADAVGEAIHGRHERGFVMWPLISDAGEPPQEIVARALMLAMEREREECAAMFERHPFHYIVSVAIRNRDTV